uniref:Phosphatidylserine decarboxylase n=1 Tax=Ditylenchus dipsaci TaxID=166011 RepID=A0A915CT02_9BILA
MILRRVGSFAVNNFRKLQVDKIVSKNESKGVKQSVSVASLSSAVPERDRNIPRKYKRIVRFVVPQRPLLRWLILGTLSGGIAIYGWQLFAPDYRSKEDPGHYYSDWKIRLYTSLPLNAVSRMVGALANVPVPVSLRESVYGTYAKAYDCRMDEAVEESFNAYPTFAAFFNRNLKEGTRPISSSLLVSPADGTVTHFGKVVDGRVEYVKGNDYEIHEFLGPINTDTKVGHSLFQVVIYLAPGDYHAFHSPAHWKVLEKVHHPGFLLSLCLVVSGNMLSAVAATNVGDIVIDSKPVKNRKILESEQYNVFDQNYHLSPGAKVGEFRLGPRSC